MEREQIFGAVAAERRRIADLIDTLDEDALATPSLCAGWDVKTVAAHLVSVFADSFWRFQWAALRHGGFNRAIDELARRRARDPDGGDRTHSPSARRPQAGPAGHRTTFRTGRRYGALRGYPDSSRPSVSPRRGAGGLGTRLPDRPPPARVRPTRPPTRNRPSQHRYRQIVGYGSRDPRPRRALDDGGRRTYRHTRNARRPWCRASFGNGCQSDSVVPQRAEARDSHHQTDHVMQTHRGHDPVGHQQHPRVGPNRPSHKGSPAVECLRQSGGELLRGAGSHLSLRSGRACPSSCGEVHTDPRGHGSPWCPHR